MSIATKNIFRYACVPSPKNSQRNTYFSPQVFLTSTPGSISRNPIRKTLVQPPAPIIITFLIWCSYFLYNFPLKTATTFRVPKILNQMLEEQNRRNEVLKIGSLVVSIGKPIQRTDKKKVLDCRALAAENLFIVQTDEIVILVKK